MDRFALVEIEDGPRLKCFCPPELALKPRDLCIVEADRLLECGRVLQIDDEDAKAGARSVCKVLRRATLQDQARASENALMGKMARRTCMDKARKAGLQMRLVRVRYSFDRTVLMLLFAAEEHVDTREYARELGAELRTRLEIRQIGVRDEAALIGGLGPCGRKLCCCTWLRQFESVNVKMAKTQRLSLNPGAISGNCGRLKCCLRYEYEQYRELGRNLPRQGATVDCPEGVGCVIGRDIMSQRLRICLKNNRIVECQASEVKGASHPKPNERREGDENPDPERSESEPAGDEGADRVWATDA